MAFISQLLKFEFIFAPAPDIEANVDDTLDQLIERGILAPAISSPSDSLPLLLPTAASGALTAASVSAGRSCTHLMLQPSGVDSFFFLSMLSWPYVETYWVALASLLVLLPDVRTYAKTASSSVAQLRPTQLQRRLSWTVCRPTDSGVGLGWLCCANVLFLFLDDVVGVCAVSCR